MSATQLERARPAAGRPAAAALPPLITRPLLVRFVSVIGAETSFFLPLSVVPLYVKSSSGSGAGAGLATAALLAAGVAGEPATPRVVSRCLAGPGLGARPARPPPAGQPARGRGAGRDAQPSPAAAGPGPRTP